MNIVIVKSKPRKGYPDGVMSCQMSDKDDLALHVRNMVKDGGWVKEAMALTVVQAEELRDRLVEVIGVLKQIKG